MLFIDVPRISGGLQLYREPFGSYSALRVITKNMQRPAVEGSLSKVWKIQRHKFGILNVEERMDTEKKNK